jgi:hypothetical protein
LSEPLPQAIITKNGTSSPNRWWIVAILGGIVSIGLFVFSIRTSGTLIVIEFREGFGIKPEDRLRHHGIDVGEVTQVELSDDLERVLVSVRLHPNAKNLAVEGSQFWIVRPSLSLDSVSGLDTILGAKYLSVKPGADSSKPANRFLGLDTPPIAAVKDGSLEIFLDGVTRGGLSNGAPILYRGYRVGSIVQVGLATDARSVRARCAIDPEYRDLVRTNTHFWNRSGWRLNVGLSGIKLDADSMSQILSGGIEMATPENVVPAVNMGHTFVLHETAQPEWSEWQPSIGHGTKWHDMERNRPIPLRIALRWQERSFGFRSNKQTAGWCLPLDDGTILCLPEQVIAPKNALADSITIEFAGIAYRPESIELVGATDESTNPIVFRSKEPLPSNIALWPTKDLKRNSSNAANIAVASGDPGNSIAIDANRITVEEGMWTLDSPQLEVEDVVGAPVVDAESNQVVGLAAKRNKKTVVVLLAK